MIMQKFNYEKTLKKVLSQKKKRLVKNAAVRKLVIIYYLNGKENGFVMIALYRFMEKRNK